MPLIGALSNQHDKLMRLAELRTRLLSQADCPGRPVVQLRPRSGVIKDAVLQVLRAADAAMSVRDVHAAVERQLGTPVSKDSVNSCLSTGARGAGARFERLSPGLYRLRRQVR